MGTGGISGTRATWATAKGSTQGTGVGGGGSRGGEGNGRSVVKGDGGRRQFYNGGIAASQPLAPCGRATARAWAERWLHRPCPGLVLGALACPGLRGPVLACPHLSPPGLALRLAAARRRRVGGRRARGRRPMAVPGWRPPVVWRHGGHAAGRGVVEGEMPRWAHTASAGVQRSSGRPVRGSDLSCASAGRAGDSLHIYSQIDEPDITPHPHLTRRTHTPTRLVHYPEPQRIDFLPSTQSHPAPAPGGLHPCLAGCLCAHMAPWSPTRPPPTHRPSHSHSPSPLTSTSTLTVPTASRTGATVETTSLHRTMDHHPHPPHHP